MPPVNTHDEIAKVAAEAARAAVDEALAKHAASQKVTSNVAGLDTATHATVKASDMRDAAEGTGLNLARFVKAQALAQMTGRTAPAILRAQGYANAAAVVEKALAQSDLGAGGALVPDAFSAELIELLRAKTVVRKAGARTIPMGASLTIPKQTAAATAFYGPQENTAITASQQGLGNVQLSEKKLTALTAISNDLIRNASISAEQFVRDDLVAILARREDLAFLRGSGSAFEPKGIINWAVAGNKFGQTASSPPTLAEVKADMAKLISKLEANDAPMLNVAWVFHPRVKNFLMGLTETTGASAFESMLAQGKFYGGFPFFTTTQLPTNLGASGNRTEIILADFSDVIIGDSLGLTIEVFPNGAWSNGGSVVSGISSDQTAVRAIAKHDIAARHGESVAVITDSSYGA